VNQTEPSDFTTTSSVVFGARDRARAVFAGDEPAVAIHGVAVRVVRWLTEDRDGTVGFVPAHHAVVGNVGPHEIAPGGEPGRPLRPAKSGREFFDRDVAVNEGAKARVVDFEVLADHFSCLNSG
jgi:hypothetical protein